MGQRLAVEEGRWRIDPHADYGLLNGVARIPATSIMRTLYVSDHATQLALAVADFGRIDKTIHEA
jgi:TnpA family transposase